MENIDIEKYDDINYLSTLLFDFLYNKKSDREIMVEHINLKDIKSSTIKKLYQDKHLRKLILNVFNFTRDFILILYFLKKRSTLSIHYICPFHYTSILQKNTP